MTLEQLRTEFLAAAKRERADTWCNTQDREAWQAIHRERARVFELCAASVGDLQADELKRATEIRLNPPVHTTYWDVGIEVSCRASIESPTSGNAQDRAIAAVEKALGNVNGFRVVGTRTYIRP
jgi:hypothetical protein